MKRVLTASFLIVIALLLSGCAKEMYLNVKSMPTEADIYLISQKTVGQEQFIGKTDFEAPYKFSFESEQEVQTIIAKKYGYQDANISLQYSKDYDPNFLIDLKKLEKQKMAIAVPTVENEKVIFKLAYDWGYRDTIENSPNALNVERVVTADNLKELLGKFDVKAGKLAFVRSFPEKAINEAAYVEQFELLNELIEQFKKIKTKDDAERVLQFFNLKSNNYRVIFEDDYTKIHLHLMTLADGKKTQYANDEIAKVIEMRIEKIKTISLGEMYSELWMANTAGGFAKTRLTNTNKRYTDQSPSVTKDGGNVYFSSNRNGRTFNIWRLSTEGGQGITKITTSPYSNDFNPSVDGKDGLVAYKSYPLDVNEPQIWTIKTNGSLPSQLRPGSDVSMCSNGDMIAFGRESQEGVHHIWTMKSNGAAETMITVNTSIDETYPSFSPDCKWITYQSNESGNQDIYIMKIDGSSKIQLTTNPSVDSSPIWGDDGYIYFRSNRGLIWGIWRLKALI